MKRIATMIAVLALAMSVLAMTSCGKSEFNAQVNDEKSITITAVKADEGDSVLTGSLEVKEGEQIAIEPNLESGSIELKFIASPDEESAEEMPDMNDEDAVYTTTLSGTDSQAISFGTGSFMVKPTVTEKATGTIEITVQAAK